MLTFIDKKELLPQNSYKADCLSTTTMNIMKEMKFLVMENVTKFLSQEESSKILSVLFF
jgi:hypothetical protein